jgi:acetyl esterase
MRPQQQVGPPSTPPLLPQLQRRPFKSPSPASDPLDSLSLGLPAVWEAPLHILRANTRGRLPLAGPPDPILHVTTTFFTSPTADVPVRIYRPTASSAAPALLWFHGGGWVLNYLDLYDACLTRLANGSGCTIVSVCYQKAPEHRFPVPFDDCYAALMWVRANAQQLQVSCDV